VETPSMTFRSRHDSQYGLPLIMTTLFDPEFVRTRAH